MGLLIGQRDRVTVKLTAVMIGDLGKDIKVTFKGTYKKLAVSEAQQLLNDLNDDNTPVKDEDVITEHLLSWSEMPAPEASESDTVAFSPEALAEALEVDGYRRALVEGFMAVQFGREFLKRKN